MTVNNNSNLINQICTVSGLQGKDLAAFKARLAKMSEAELQAELTKAIAGNNSAGDLGLIVEKTIAAPASVDAQTLTTHLTQTQILKEKQCKEVACQIINDNLSEAFDLFNSQHLGVISGAYNDAKNEDNKLKASNVAKVLDYQNKGFIQIVEAKNHNLTKRAYYEENKQRIKDMIITRLNVLKTSTGTNFIDSYRGKYSREEMTDIINAYVERLCSDASIENLKDIQKQFVSYNQAEEPKALSNFIEKAKDFNENWSDTTINALGTEGKPQKIKGLDKGIVPEYWNSNEPISFEEVYKLERGIEYSQLEVEKYVQAKTEMETIINAHNKKQQFVDFAEALREEELTHPEKEKKLLAGFAEFYTLSVDGGLSQLQKIIDKSKLPITIENGNLKFDTYADESSKIKVMNSLLKIAGQEKEKDFKAFLGDKTLEEYQFSFEGASNLVLGEENSKLLADAMLDDNMGMIKRYTGNTSMAGMALTVVGGVLCFTPAAPLGAVVVTAGNALAIGGMAAKTGLGAADYATKDVRTNEELEDLAKDFIMDAGGFIIGMKAGQAGMKAFSKLIDKKLAAVFSEQIAQGNKAQAIKTVFTNPDYLKSFTVAGGAKISTDFLISYMGDMAMMGALDTKDDWRSLLQANLTGILVGMSGDVKDVAGVGKVKVKPSEITAPRGKYIDDGVLIQNAKTENPAEVVSDKVKQQWTQADVNTRAPEEPVNLFNIDSYAGLSRSADDVNGDVTSLILTGKLKDVLTQRYDEMGNVFKDIAKARSADIKKLASECGNDKQAFANGVVSILAEEMNMKGLEPKIELIDMNRQADGLAHWDTGAIQIDSSISNAKKLVEIISHEFVHMLQYRDILAQYGEQGLRELIMNNKSIPANQKDAKIAEILDSSYTQKLLNNFNVLHYSKTGSVNEYITRIYKDEFANPLAPDDNMKEYTEQTIESEAYKLGSEQLANAAEALEQVEIREDAHNDISLGALRKKLKQKLKNGEQVEHQKINVSTETLDEFTIDEFGQIHRTNVPKGIASADYPIGTYTSHQIQIIKNKFEALKNEVKSKNYQFDSRLEELEKLEEIILNVKDPKLQEQFCEIVKDIKDWDVPGTFGGAWTRINFYGSSSYEKLGSLLELNFVSDKDYISVDSDGKVKFKDIPFLDMERRLNSYEIREKLENVVNDNTNPETGLKYTADEMQTKINEAVHKIQMNAIGIAVSNVKHKSPNLENYLYETYIYNNLTDKQSAALKKINDKLGRKVDLHEHSADLSFESIENFSNLSDNQQKHFLNNPELLHSVYLSDINNNKHFEIETPLEVLSSLTEDEWNIFNKRKLAKYADVIIGVERSRLGHIVKGNKFRTLIEMNDDKWQKMNDFGLLDIKDGKERFYTRHNEDLKFNIDDMMNIVENISYKEWNTIKKRGILDIKPGEYSILKCGCNNDGSHIGVDIITVLGKIPDSTFNFLKYKLDLFKNDILDIKIYEGYEQQANIAKGIEFLSRSHNDTYQRVMDLKHAGFESSTALEIAGISSGNYGRLGRFIRDRAIELKNKGVEDNEVPNILTLYTDLYPVKGKRNINELSIIEKRNLLKNLTKYNAEFFNKNYKVLLESEIIPKDKDEYCSLLPKLVKAVGIDTKPVSETIISNYEKAMQSMAEPNSPFLRTKITKDNFKLTLEYPRQNFIQDVVNAVRDLPQDEKMKVYDYFGFEFKTDSDGNISMNGYPVNINNGAKMAEIQSETTKNTVEYVRPLVDRFINDNKIQVNDNFELSEQLNEITNLFPEFKSIIGKKQHSTHDFTVDVHTLKVLQGVMSDPQYKTLPEADKRILNIATLMHDITKTEGVIDKTHPQYSAYDTYYLLGKMNLPEAERLKIYSLIKNHDWLERYNGKIYLGNSKYRDMTDAERATVAKDIALELRNDNVFKMAAILAKADTKGVKENDTFFNKYSETLARGTDDISKLITQIKQTSIHLPQTQVPKASEIKIDENYVKEISSTDSHGNIIKNKVIYLKPGMDLGELGFAKGLKSEDLNLVVHAITYDTQGAILQSLGQIDSDALLSTSYVTYAKGNYHVFRPQGFILDVASSDIHAGTYKDFGSGYGKDLNALKNDYLFGGERKGVREFLSNRLKKKLNLSDSQYAKIAEKIADKSITELDKEYPEIAKAYREIFSEMEIHKRKYGRDYNEWLVSRPKIQGVFFQGSEYRYKSAEDIPEFLRIYAHENDLPIIYFGE